MTTCCLGDNFEGITFDLSSISGVSTKQWVDKIAFTGKKNQQQKNQLCL